MRDMRRGFTLIELLVVIAIIAILAAILFPVFARARENARKSTCQSNLKQIATSMLMYVQDYDERSIPPTMPGTQWTRGNTCSGCFQQYEAGLADARNAGGPRWAPLMPYIKNTQVWYCPSSMSWQSYGWCRGGENRIMAQIQTPAQLVMFGDSRRTGLNGSPAGTSSWLTRGSIAGACCTSRQAAEEVQNPHRVGDVHMDGANLAFWDGHVKWTRSTALLPNSRTTYPVQFEIADRN